MSIRPKNTSRGLRPKCLNPDISLSRVFVQTFLNFKESFGVSPAPDERGGGSPGREPLYPGRWGVKGFSKYTPCVKFLFNGEQKVTTSSSVGGRRAKPPAETQISPPPTPKSAGRAGGFIIHKDQGGVSGERRGAPPVFGAKGFPSGWGPPFRHPPGFDRVPTVGDGNLVRGAQKAGVEVRHH